MVSLLTLMMRQRGLHGLLWGGLGATVLATAEVALANPIAPELNSATQVTQVGNEFVITGGASAADGQALFHSFEQFGLTQGQIATFLSQPDIRAILGRVVGGEASVIDGLLRVSGSAADLYLVNPAGILLGANAQLDLSGSFAATTASGLQFETGTFHAVGSNDYAQLTGSPTGYVFALAAAGAVVNRADLAVAPGAAITLIGGQVISTGTLTAPGGDITIAAIPDRNLVRISHPHGLLSLELETLPDTVAPTTGITPLSLPTLLTGTGAEVATGLMVQPDGTIALVNGNTEFAPAPGTAIATGRLDAADQSGGDVTLVGDRVGLLNATVDVSGSRGGGTVRIGGDYQGAPTLPGSTLTVVDGGSQIRAQGGQTGNGGRVILWSDGRTIFRGAIAAQGGDITGDGGFVEVSGAESLTFRGDVDTTAAAGAIGELLLDPVNITILSGTADGDDSDGLTNDLSETDVAIGDPAPTQIYESELEDLDGNTNLTLRASNTITIADLADDELLFEAGIGSITFEAGGTFQMLDTNDTIRARERPFTITADTITVGNIDNSDFNGLDGAITLQATGAISTGDLETYSTNFASPSSFGDITVTGSSLQTGVITAGDSDFVNVSRVELTSTSGDVIVERILVGARGLEINAARRFQARASREEFLFETRLDLPEDAELIDFLMRGDPQPLVDAGLIDSGAPVTVEIPVSIVAYIDSADSGVGPIPVRGEIVIRHGGQVGTVSANNITIAGTGAYPDIQFVSGPNNDHEIRITPEVATADFRNFTPFGFPSEAFPAEASGTVGAIIRRQTDSTLVTSFQNQPFVPVEVPPELPPEPPTNPENPTIEVRTTSFERLTVEAEEEIEAVEDDAAAIATEDVPPETCTPTLTARTETVVEIGNTCESPSDDREDLDADPSGSGSN